MATKTEKNLRPRSLSPTCIEAFLQCTLKFWYRYHTKEPEVGDTTALRFGSAVHSALEAFAKKLQAGAVLDTDLCESIAQNEFMSAAAENRIIDPALIKEGQDMMRARYNRHNPTYPIVAVELNFSKMKMTTDKGVPINGIIDLVQEMTPDMALIVDYKTSRRAKTPSEAQSDVQLSMYDLLISKKYPKYSKVWLALEFLRSEAVISDRVVADRVSFERWLNELWVNMGDQHEKDVKPTINQYCPWCGYKHLCHAFKHVLDADIQLIPTASLDSTTVFTEEWKKAKALEKIASERILELKAWANNAVELEGLFKFEDDTSVLSWNQSSRTFYDAKTLLPHIPLDDLARIVSIKNEALLTYVNNERPDLKPVVDAATRSTVMGARITTRKK